MLQRIIDGSRKEFHFAPLPVSKNKHLDVLADIISFCLIVVPYLNQRTVSNMIDLIHGATGFTFAKEDLRDRVRAILQMEARLQNKLTDESSLPGRRPNQ
jgi:aldehyde:ferredoxin oxidoreductase